MGGVDFHAAGDGHRIGDALAEFLGHPADDSFATAQRRQRAGNGGGREELAACRGLEETFFGFGVRRGGGFSRHG